MKNLKIFATPQTPGIDLNYETGILTFHGRSMPEDPVKFYESSLDWVNEYVLNPQPKTVVNIEYEYINTASSRSLIKILTILSILSKNIDDTVYNWGYEKEDEDMLDLAANFEEILGIKFNFIIEKF
jgi:hypothetical protein